MGQEAAELMMAYGKSAHVPIHTHNVYACIYIVHIIY